MRCETSGNRTWVRERRTPRELRGSVELSDRFLERFREQRIGIGVVVAKSRLEKLEIVVINPQRCSGVAGAQQDVCKAEGLELLDRGPGGDRLLHRPPRLVEIATLMRKRQRDPFPRGRIRRLPVFRDRFVKAPQQLQCFGAMEMRG